MEYIIIIVRLALAQYMFFLTRVGAARGRLGINAPSCMGNEQFERIFRVQQNTLEQLIIFIPALFAFAHYVHPVWAVGLGVIYLAGRFVYSNAYLSDPAKRGAGMLMTFITNGILVLGAIIGAGLILIKQ